MKTSRPLLRNKFESKKYRDAFVRAYTREHIAAQLFTLRMQNSYTQKKLASLAGMSQKSISELEDPNKHGISLNTLFRLASTFDVPLIVKFGSYDEFFRIASDDSYEELAPATFDMYRADKSYSETVSQHDTREMHNQAKQIVQGYLASNPMGAPYGQSGSRT